jgi:mono/diheme cytochrome c family protein
MRHISILSALAIVCGVVTCAGAEEPSFALLKRGKALTDAGDCVACHTAEKGKPFAGGRPVETPFGTIYSANITPDTATGIGNWTSDDFYRAMHEGVDPAGHRLYPAFPYPYFTKLTREDVEAIRVYLRTLDPVKNTPRANDLIWPLNYRVFLRGWNWMFFDAGTFAPDPHKSAVWNRGAYLVEGPGHCGACHTPKNIFGADKKDQRLAGGQLQNWFAPRITNAARRGIGSWQKDEIVEYLKTGRNAHSGATGLMAEVVADSTSKMSKEDLEAIATYLKDTPGSNEGSSDKPSAAVMPAGEAIFKDSCAGCHQSNGEGVGRMFPPLKANANAQSADPTTVLRVILNGAQTVATDARPTPVAMPAYRWKLSDAQIAAVASYVRNAWGNSAPAVSKDDVKSERGTLQSKRE